MKNKNRPIRRSRSSKPGRHDKSHDRFFKAVFGEPEHAIAWPR